jgi:hypothetical protein
MSDSNKNLLVDLRWVPDTKTNWPIDRRSQNNLNLKWLLIDAVMALERASSVLK